MQIVIDIPKEDYNFIKKQVTDGIYNPLKVFIANGTPLDEVLDKIRSEIDRQEKWLLQAGCTAYNVDIVFDAIKSAVGRGDEE